jgi:photoactive yellow protein
MEPFSFTAADLHLTLSSASAEALHRAEFGIIELDASGRVTFYNQWESRLAGLPALRVLGRNFFREVAPCCNNFMVAQRFAEPAELDDTIDYVFTLRMRPSPVKLRLLMSMQLPQRYILVERS